MRLRSLILAIAATVITTGCASQGNTFNQTVITEPKTSLVRGHSIYIATPKNGWYENVEYPGSGRIAASNIRAAFARFSDHVVVSDQCQDLACLKRTNPGVRNAYFVVPEILHWESRDKNWTMRPDVIEVKISVFDHDHSKSAASAILSSKNKNSLFSGDRPQDTLQDPVNRYVSSLY